MPVDKHKDQIKKLRDQLALIHADYLERFAVLKKRQLQLLKQVMARTEAEKIKHLSKQIKKKTSK